jgi:hypothetical protein
MYLDTKIYLDTGADPDIGEFFFKSSSISSYLNKKYLKSMKLY